MTTDELRRYKEALSQRMAELSANPGDRRPIATGVLLDEGSG